MTNAVHLVEYLFIDEPRIERYFQQLSAPVRYDKLPVWKVALGLTGPAVEGTQSRLGREFSLNEKLEEVLRHIESEELTTSFDRAVDEWDEKPFVSERLVARQAIIERKDKRLKIWVSVPAEKSVRKPFPRAVYLIEDFRGSDDFPNDVSGYHTLSLLFHELEWVEPPLAEPINQLMLRDRKLRRFASDPIGSLKLIGAEFGPERLIHAVYRFRAECFDETTESETTIGYPLVILEA